MTRQVLVAQPSREPRYPFCKFQCQLALRCHKFYCRRITGRGGPEFATFQNLFILDRRPSKDTIRIWIDSGGLGLQKKSKGGGLGGEIAIPHHSASWTWGRQESNVQGWILSVRSGSDSARRAPSGKNVFANQCRGGIMTCGVRSLQTHVGESAITLPSFETECKGIGYHLFDMYASGMMIKTREKIQCDSVNSLRPKSNFHRITDGARLELARDITSLGTLALALRNSFATEMVGTARELTRLQRVVKASQPDHLLISLGIRLGLVTCIPWRSRPEDRQTGTPLSKTQYHLENNHVPMLKQKKRVQESRVPTLSTFFPSHVYAGSSIIENVVHARRTVNDRVHGRPRTNV
ncbi:hypothetical protein HD554DRAFT_872800 [Boletus coccyginus]|nr:hypothetical protein HD554DRAFT_872800 [Boletus coccyginus]